MRLERLVVMFLEMSRPSDEVIDPCIADRSHLGVEEGMSLLDERKLCLPDDQNLGVSSRVKELPPSGNAFPERLVQSHTLFC